MPISADEQKALDELKAQIVKVKCDCVDFQLHISKLSEAELKTHGFKSHADGYAYKLKMAKAKIADLEKAFLRKYPDGKGNGK